MACSQCKANSTDVCNQNGCFFLENGNGAPKVSAHTAMLVSYIVPGFGSHDYVVSRNFGYRKHHAQLRMMAIAIAFGSLRNADADARIICNHYID